MKKPENLDWKMYESITKYIYETLGQQHGVTIKGYGHTCKVTGKSGTSYQIDVLTAHGDGIHEYQTAIECKYWKEKVTRDTVAKVLGLIEDTNISKGVIVSKSGFTPDAVEYARHKGIGLVELREVEESDAEGQPGQLDLAIIEIRTAITIRRPIVSRIEIDSVENTEIEREFWINKYMVRLSNGSNVPFSNYLQDFQNELQLQKKVGETISKQYEVPGAILINNQKRSSENINLITLTGVLTKIDKNETRQITLVDQVWLIMKTIFEQQTFMFTENGIIVKK